MMKFSTQNLQNVFEEEGKFEGFRSVASSLVRGQSVFELDDNGNERRISNADANKAIRKVFMEICGLTEEDLKSRKKRERAEKLHGVELFEIIEEDVDWVINEGFQENEFFNKYVEMKNHALGDANAFYVNNRQFLIVGNYAGDHHDVTIQQIGEGEEIFVKCTSHTVKIGKDIDLIILGRYDYAKMIRKISEAYINDIQNMIYTNFYAASDKIPAGSGLKMTGALSAATKPEFDKLIENVQIVNGSEAVIVGTKVALKNLNAITDVDWATAEQKDSVMRTGRLGYYEGTAIMEVPQRLKVGGSLTNEADRLIPNDTLLILPVNEEQFVKFFDEGETQIFEVEGKASLKDDFQTYEVRRDYGCDVVLGQYFGRWDKE